MILPPLHQLLRNISILAGESSSGSDRRITHFFYGHKKYNPRSGRKRTKDKRTKWTWVNSSARRLSCDTLHSFCISRLTLACISSEISTKLLGMPTHADWTSFTASGPYLMPTGHFCCPVSTPNCHSVSPFANCLLWVPFSKSWLAFPCLLPVMSRSRAQAFVWFRAKTDKGIVCLADHPHCVTEATLEILVEKRIYDDFQQKIVA